MTDFDRIRTVKEHARARLFGIPGVHGVGIGPKLVAGEPTSEPAIMVFVIKKKPLSELSPNQVIPSEIEGIKTDVVEAEIPVLQQFDEGDDRDYRPLVGGVQVQGGVIAPKEVGTLGCIGFFPDEPEPRVVGITNWHVVAHRPGLATTLTADISTDRKRIILRSFHASGTRLETVEPPGSIMLTRLVVFPDPTSPPEVLELYTQTAAGDTPFNVAQKITSMINGLNHPALTANASMNAGDGIVTLIWGPDAVVDQQPIDVNEPNKHAVYGAQISDSSANFRAKVSGRVITLSGSAPDDFYGIYTSVNVGGFPVPTLGVFVPVAKGQALTSIASALAQALNGLIIGFTATASGTQVTLSPVETIECIVWRDTRAGQPENDFGSKCSECCSDRVGRTVAARLDVDAALIQLDGGLEYKAEIQGIGFISGAHTVTEAEVMAGYTVEKRGRSTFRTEGRVMSIHFDGVAVTSTPADQPYAPRRFLDKLMIRPIGSDPFSASGDSGSAIVHTTGGTKEVVGLLFAGSRALTVATPIQSVLDAFNVAIKTATGPDQVQVVPESAGAAPAARRLNGGARAAVAPPWNRIREVEAEIGSTPEGNRFVAIVRRHMREASTLVNENRRMGVAWQRNGGPVLINAVLQAIQNDEYRLPRELMGRPLDSCLMDIAAAFRAQASRAFVSDLDRFAPAILGLGGKNYSELVDQLRMTRGSERSSSPDAFTG